MKQVFLLRIFAVVLLVTVCVDTLSAQTRRGRAPNAVGSLVQFPTRYYDIHTDLTEIEAREAAVRMTKMAEEYHARTAEFSGQIDERLGFFLFRREQDYRAAGGIPGTAGVFDGRRLMAVAGEKLDARTWHVVQHEGFHQFAHSVIRGDMPIWVNEGLAEYFGEAIFTGDSFVSGAIPNWRLKRVKEAMTEGRFKTIEQMMTLTHPQWNAEMNINNYDQAWTMVQFLAHADGGKYQKPFGRFMTQLNQGRPWTTAWRDSFGSAEGFEKLWRAWWMSLEENPTDDLYARAAVETLTSFLARSTAQKQTFASFDEFTTSAADETLQASQEDWLPPSLIQETLVDVESRRKRDDVFTLAPAGPNTKQPMVVLQRADGRRVVGRFVLRAGRVQSIKVDTTTRPLAAPKSSAGSK